MFIGFLGNLKDSKKILFQSYLISYSGKTHCCYCIHKDMVIWPQKSQSKSHTNAQTLDISDTHLHTIFTKKLQVNWFFLKCHREFSWNLLYNDRLINFSNLIKLTLIIEIIEFIPDFFSSTHVMRIINYGILCEKNPNMNYLLNYNYIVAKTW